MDCRDLLYHSDRFTASLHNGMDENFAIVILHNLTVKKFVIFKNALVIPVKHFNRITICELSAVAGGNKHTVKRSIFTLTIIECTD